jgi:hypothetical protein
VGGSFVGFGGFWSFVCFWWLSPLGGGSFVGFGGFLGVGVGGALPAVGLRARRACHHGGARATTRGRGRRGVRGGAPAARGRRGARHHVSRLRDAAERGEPVRHLVVAVVAVRVPLVAPAVLVGVEALARVRLEHGARLGVAVLVRPALGARERLAEGRAALALGVGRPLALRRALVAVEELAGRVDLVDVPLLALAARVEELLVLGVAEHAVGLVRDLGLALREGLALATLDALGVRHAGLGLGLVGVHEVGPRRRKLLDDVPGLPLGVAEPLALAHGVERAAALAGEVLDVVREDPLEAVERRGGLAVGHPGRKERKEGRGGGALEGSLACGLRAKALGW